MSSRRGTERQVFITIDDLSNYGPGASTGARPAGRRSIDRHLQFLQCRSSIFVSSFSGCARTSGISMQSEEPSSSKAEDKGRSQPNVSWTVSHLREFLKGCGGRLSGKKSELVER